MSAHPKLRELRQDRSHRPEDDDVRVLLVCHRGETKWCITSSEKYIDGGIYIDMDSWQSASYNAISCVFWFAVIVAAVLSLAAASAFSGHVKTSCAYSNSKITVVSRDYVEFSTDLKSHSRTNNAKLIIHAAAAEQMLKASGGPCYGHTGGGNLELQSTQPFSKLLFIPVVPAATAVITYFAHSYIYTYLLGCSVTRSMRRAKYLVTV